MRAVLSQASLTWLEVRRSNLIAVALWLSFGGGLVALATAEAASAAHARLVVDMGLMSASLLGTIAAMASTLTLFAADTELNQSSIALTHPIARWTLLVGRSLGLWAVLSTMVLIIGGVTLGLLTLLGSPWPAAFLFAWAATPFEIAVVLSTTLLCATLASRAIAAMMSVGLWIAGNFSEDFFVLSQAPRYSAWQKNLFSGLWALLPDYARLSFRLEAANGVAVALSEVMTSILYAMSYAGVMVTFACVVFSRRRSV